MNKLVAVLVMVSLLALTACDNNRVFEENKPIAGNSWKATDAVEFTTTINDTESPMNVYINIRNTSDYAFSNIYLFLTTTFPDGKEAKDTLNCMLADNRGKWLGTGAGDLWNNQILLKRGVSFDKKGTYKFKLEHAMRTDPLPNITDIGFRIEKAEGK